MSRPLHGPAAFAGVAALLGLCCLPLAASAAPLFESDETLPVVLELPVADVLRYAKDKPTVDAKLRYVEGDSETELSISVTTRGKYRLRNCRYPPLSLRIRKKQAASTIFEGQRRLKLVTPCRGTAEYRRYLDQEYAIYRTYNLLTDYSFRVRKLQVTFRDANGRRKDETHEAFFIEPTRSVAARLGMETVKIPRVTISQMDPQQLSIMTLFQYLIGNTDWSALKGPGDEDCCHNGKVISPANAADGWVVVPYDFDQAGIINARYATPGEKLRIRSVRQRVYRGFCRNIEPLDATIALFNEKRVEIEALFANATEKRGTNKSALRYIDSFYDIVNDTGKKTSKIVDACRDTAS